MFAPILLAGSLSTLPSMLPKMLWPTQLITGRLRLKKMGASVPGDQEAVPLGESEAAELRQFADQPRIAHGAALKRAQSHDGGGGHAALDANEPDANRGSRHGWRDWGLGIRD